MKDVMLSSRAKAAVRLALDEDLADALDARRTKWCDATSEALVDADAVATGEIYAKGTGCVVAGATVAKAVMKAVDPKIKVQILKGDGSVVKPKEPILTFRGRARSILAAERTALNFMQRMCATATLAKKFVDATKRYGTLILDTRKTTPGLRVFEKYAVTCGGGTNHRMEGRRSRRARPGSRRRAQEVPEARRRSRGRKPPRVRERAQGEAGVDHARQHELRRHEEVRQDVPRNLQDRGLRRNHPRAGARSRRDRRDSNFAWMSHALRGISRPLARVARRLICPLPQMG